LNVEIAEKIRQVIAAIGSKVPGLAAAWAAEGVGEGSVHLGSADLATGAPVDESTLFRIGSVSKPLSSAGLALLVQDGRIDLDAPLRQYIPDYADVGAGITIRQLAGHLSGIRNYKGREVLADRHWPDLRSGLGIFENDPLVAPPGAKFSYSSYNWNAIGAAIEAVTRRDFPGYMRDSVFTPLGMGHTRADFPEASRACGRYYESNPVGGFVTAPTVDNSYKWPSGGFLSNPADLVRFGSALLRPGFLDQSSLDLLFTSQRTMAGEATHYGIGWYVGRTVVYHGGDIKGGTAVLMLVPSARVVVAVAANRGPFTLDKAAGGPVLKRAADQYSSQVLTKGALQVARLLGPAGSPRGA
jgi:CubicO group peptidase (beta-lactamase class C family)